MGQHQKNPLRPVSEEEQEVLKQVSRGQREPASHVARAKALLAVVGGQNFTAAAQAAGRRSGDAVAQLVARFNEAGLAALEPRHGGGPALKYGAAEQERILREARCQPEVAKEGTATWSLSTLQQALRQAEDGVPDVSTYTIWMVLQANGFRWQKDVSWCETGQVKRKRQAGVVEVTDPDTTPKKH